ncbi:hypothetical protein ABT024_38440 [Streptomyces sp. NPDC002812]|uniref:hypothetical protein n=1 Tax=Streptomyces sp. NPDC002812 TaxID=3154434 RepID=UPI00331F2944
MIAAADPYPLKAALDAVWHTIATYGEHCPELLREIRWACPEQATSSAPASPPRPYDAVELFPQLAPLARTATRLHPRPGSPTPHDSSIGGPLLWPAEEPWPHCDHRHVVDGVNRPTAPADVRSWRRINAASRGRSLTPVADILDTPPDPPATQFDGYVPEPCLLRPEQATEYPDHLELSKELRGQIENWSPWEIAEEGGEYESSPEGFYDDALSAAPGWKVGGWPRWGATDPRPRPCPECGTEMDALLTIASFERNGEECPWFAHGELEGQPLAGFDPVTPTAVQIGRGYAQQLYVCPAVPEHPHIELMHQGPRCGWNDP